MTIVCFEGPSAVGKTTTARALSASNGIEVVPDVAGLFERPSDEPPDWYLERQVERWRRAREAFYRPRIVRRDLGFPNLYVVFTASVHALRQRKSSDPGRARRHFEHHLSVFDALMDWLLARVA